MKHMCEHSYRAAHREGQDDSKLGPKEMRNREVSRRVASALSPKARVDLEPEEVEFGSRLRQSPFSTARKAAWPNNHYTEETAGTGV